VSAAPMAAVANPQARTKQTLRVTYALRFAASQYNPKKKRSAALRRELSSNAPPGLPHPGGAAVPAETAALFDDSTGP